MANVNAPFGLKPIRGASSQPYNDGTQIFQVPATDSTAVKYGDPVTVTGDASATGVPYVARTAAGSNAITGVAVGFRPLGNTEWLGYRPASVAYEVMVECDPASEYLIMEDSDGGALAAADVGLNATFVFGAATGENSSVAMLDSSTKATTAGLPLRIMGLAQIVNNAIGQYAVWRVRLNNVTTTPNAASTGA